MGFLSNRLFDAAACGAHVVSDKIDGLDEVFEGLIQSYETPTELAELSSSAAVARWDPTRAGALRNLVLSGHTFTHRAEALLAKARELTEARLSGRHISDETADAQLVHASSPRRVLGLA
jgi:spore maturation protein CgeB